MECVRPSWSENGRTTLAVLRDEMAKSACVDCREGIVVASLSAEVPSVFGVDLQNLSYVVAMLWKKSEAVPQLTSRHLGAKHVFAVGEAMCLRHGRRCSLSGCRSVDVLVADRVVDLKMLAAAVSFVQPRIVVVLVAGARVNEDGLKTALGPGWEVSSVTKTVGSLGLPLCGEVVFHFLRLPGVADPAQFLRCQAHAVMAMENLLMSVEPSLTIGWDQLSGKKTETPESEVGHQSSRGGDTEDEKSVIAEVAKNDLNFPGRESDLMQFNFPSSVWAQLSAAQKRRAVLLLAWVVHSKADSACCDLDAVRGCVYAGAALPDTGGLKMFLALRCGADGGIVAKTFTPYHVLAVRGYASPGRVNLSTISPVSAQRAAEAAFPAVVTTATILAVMRTKNTTCSHAS